MQNKSPHIIAPSLLSADFGRLAEEIVTLQDMGVQMFHLDIMDGHFVPNLTFGMPVIKSIAGVATIPLDAHLMVTNPTEYVVPFAEIGIKYFSFHIETVHHSHRLVGNIKQHKMRAGIALNPGTPVSTVLDLLPDVDFILVMSVNPGFSGQRFIEHTLQKIVTLAEYRTAHSLDFQIEIDGGVNSDNIQSIVTAGADIVVASSFIFNTPDRAKALRSLTNV